MSQKSALRRTWKGIILLLVVGLCLGTGLLWIKLTTQPKETLSTQVVHSRSVESVGGMMEIPAGRLPLGSHFATSPADRPLPTVRIESFWMDATEVTNRQFTEFVAATGYVTVAERAGSSMVFHTAERTWKETAGADWRHPQGPDSSIAGRENFPVVQVAWQDAAAYARWAGKRLPTEYEWEYAARGGLYDADFPWGRQEAPDGEFQANTWQGWFPEKDRATDGYADLAPVGSYLPNGYGLVDMSGNVWEWCADKYEGPQTDETTALTTLDSELDTPQKRSAGVNLEERRMRRGGSWLCCENYSLGGRLSSRSSVPVSYRSNHLGFRCVSDEPTILPWDTANRESETEKVTR